MIGLIRLVTMALLLLVGTAACTHSPRYTDHRPWKHEYYYYPHVGVYFHISSGNYFYRDRGTWVRVKVLPKRYFLDHRVRRTFVIEDDVPYRHHAYHRKHHKAPPAFKHDRRNDHAERKHNRRRHQDYREREAHPRPR